MVYVVKVQYYKFTFRDRLDALDFAEMAKFHGEDNISVEVKIVNEEEADE